MDSMMTPANVKGMRFDFTEHIDVLLEFEQKRFINPKRLVVDYHLLETDSATMERTTAAAPHDFLLDFFHEYNRVKHAHSEDAREDRFATTLSESRARCYYHIHNDETPAWDNFNAVKAGSTNRTMTTK